MGLHLLCALVQLSLRFFAEGDGVQLYGRNASGWESEFLWPVSWGTGGNASEEIHRPRHTRVSDSILLPLPSIPGGRTRRKVHPTEKSIYDDIGIT